MLDQTHDSAALANPEAVERAAALIPALRDRAGETERQRRIPAQSLAALRAADLMRLLQPRRFGGDEGDFRQFVALAATLARGCGSTGWFWSLTAICQWMLALFPLAAQEDVWGENADAIVEAVIAPSAAAERCEGGYRIAGRWNFASGCDHADWLLAGVLLPGAARPEPGFLLLPRCDFRIEHNWYTVGLAGTGSKDIVIDGAFVPAHRMVSFAALSSGAAPGTAAHPAPLYRLPFMTVIPMAIAAPALGIAEDALADFLAMARGRLTKGAAAGGGGKMAEFGSVQSRVAEAQGLVDAARLLLLRDIEDALRAVASGAALDLDRRIRNRRGHALAVKFCVEAVNLLYAATGASGLFLANRLQRAWRDVNSIAKHIGVNWDAVGVMAGQHALGLEPKGQY
ncbi:MAG: acyl-CoA dehydrogenase family protein [Stellaceae bacterium]